MDTKALRQKVLDLAIRGKLVPQDPNDEPASVLLERIRAQKQQMVKEGKLKAKDIKNDSVIFKGEDNLHYEKFADGTVNCIENKIPFEIPKEWEWSRLGSISNTILYGLNNSAKSSGTHRLLRITDIQDGKVDWDSVPFTTVATPDEYLLAADDIVFARTGATVGKSFLIKDLPYDSVYASYLIRIRLMSDLMPEYFYQFFNSGNYWMQINDKSIGVGQPNCNGTSLRELLIPIPPVGEQIRVVSVAKEALRFVSMIDNDKEELVNTINQTKARILDLAIRGKLVPQNPADEPASVLLERIKAEKEELIKQGKIKRDKNESIIFKGEDNSYYEKMSDGTLINIDNEIPFKVPEKWTFARLSSLTQIISKGTTPRGGKVAYSSTGVGFIRAENIQGYSVIDLTSLKYVDENSHYGFLKRSILQENDILITIAGTLGRTGVVKSEMLPLNTNQAVAFIRLTYQTKCFIDYITYAINAATIKKALLQKSVEMAIPNLSLENISDIIIPLPPTNEQERIVNVVRKLFEYSDSIKSNLE